MRNRPICFVIFTLLSAASAMRAQDAVRSTNTDQEEAAETETQEIVVSATRLETPINQVGSSVTVITDEEIERNQRRSLPDVLQTAPGLNIVQTGGPGGKT